MPLEFGDEPLRDIEAGRQGEVLLPGGPGRSPLCGLRRAVLVLTVAPEDGVVAAGLEVLGESVGGADVVALLSDGAGLNHRRYRRVVARPDVLAGECQILPCVFRRDDELREVVEGGV